MSTNVGKKTAGSLDMKQQNTGDTSAKRILPRESEGAYTNKQNLDYILKSGLAGGVAGSCAKTLIAPLDRIKILFQTSNPHYVKYAGSFQGLLNAGVHIWSRDGMRGFFQGHSATLLRIFPYAAVKFIAYEQIRNIIIPSKEYETHFRRLCSGSLAGLCSVFCTYPLDLIRVRLAYVTEHHKVRVWPLIKKIYQEPASQSLSSKSYIPNWFAHWCNFYRGYIPTVIGMIPYAGVSFFAHDLFHDILRHPLIAPYSVLRVDDLDADDFEVEVQKTNSGKKIPLNTWAELLAGGLAGMTSQTAAYPFEIIRRRLQVGAVTNPLEHKFTSMPEMAKIIFHERGWGGFFVGLSIGYIKVTPMVACSFFVYERMKWYMNI